MISKSYQSEMSRNCRHTKAKEPNCLHRNHIQLPNLRSMDLSGNKITHMQLLHHQYADHQVDFGKMEQSYDPKKVSIDLLYPALEGLNLVNNNLMDEFNPNIGHQRYLKWIKLSGNHCLERIPMQFGLLKNGQLTELSMDHLPNLVEPPAEYRDVKIGMLGSLLTYMRSRLKK